MAAKMTVGVFSPNDPRPWVRRENLDLMLAHEAGLIQVLRQNGIRVVRGGDGFARQDQIAWNTRLVQAQVKKIAAKKPQALIVNHGSWTFPYDSVDAVRYFMAETGDLARVVMFSYKDTQVPGLVAGMAAAGGLKRIGVPFQLVYGVIDRDPKTEKNLLQVLEFFRRRAAAAAGARRVLAALARQKFLAFGGMSLKMPTTTADVDQWQKVFGITYQALDQSVLMDRALRMIRFTGAPGESEYVIKDKRLRAALHFLINGRHGHFDFSRPKLQSVHKFVLQLALYYAALDVCEEEGATFTGIKCQDELSAHYCTACLATAFLNNDVGPEGKRKQIIPTACDCDMDSALSQLILSLLSGAPAGFGDFRDVEKGRLAIVNCGQHPPYFFGKPGESGKKKLDRVEYLGQEIFYDAGGSAVRGRTPGGEIMTVARLGRENLKYQLVATIIRTEPVRKKEHERYNPSWPIIKGRLFIPDQTLIKIWPCNHLGFAYGDWTPHLAELAHRLDIGHLIFDQHGREHYKPVFQ
jgi:L-fucose isomerase-like protein